MEKKTVIAGFLLFTTCAAFVSVSAQPSSVAPQANSIRHKQIDKQKSVDFQKQIQPMLAKHCYSCHGAKKQESGLRLDRKSDALTGGERGAPIVAGNAKKSLLYQYVAGLDPDIVMPPEDDTLSKKQIELIRRWIDDGADWPDNKSK